MGNDVILLSEVLPEREELLRRNQGRVPDKIMHTEMVRLIAERLPALIQNHLVLEDVRRKVPAKNLPDLKMQFIESFEKDEAPRMMKALKVETRKEFVNKLREMGRSIDQVRNSYIDRTLARAWVAQRVKDDKEITHEEMLAWYEAHRSEYEFEAKARWEQIAIAYGAKRTKAQAWAELGRLGNMLLDGAAFADVARKHSEGATAKQGGLRDWTTKGSLVSAELDEALFSLPVGQLSRRIETDGEFHIIRVLERRSAGRVPFVEAQVGIKTKLRDMRRNAKLEAYLNKVKEQSKVHTILDDMPDAKTAAGGA